MEAAAKDTLELQDAKEPKVNKVLNGSSSVQIWNWSPAIIVIVVMVLHMNVVSDEWPCKEGRHGT